MVSRTNNVGIKLIKCPNEFIPIGPACNEIDAELAIAINKDLKGKMRQRRLKKYKITTAGNISRYNNAVATYSNKCRTKRKQKDVLVSVFRISKDFLQENYIVDGSIKTTYYKIIRNQYEYTKAE